MFKSGFVSLNGRPNVGKSTLINALVGSKICIISSKAQTTRNKISAVYNDSDSQIVFIDTPGIHKPHNKLGEFMNKEAINATYDVDRVIMIIDGSSEFGSGDNYVLDTLRGKDIILVINKIDLISKEQLFELIKKLKELYPFRAIVPLSAKNNENVDELIRIIKKDLNEGPKYFPDDMICDHPEEFIIGELVREKMLYLLKDEVPHSIACYVESIKKGPHNVLDISCVIVCERDSQKGIIIGKGGQMIKKIGIMARKDIEKLLGNRVNLVTFVKVKENWRDTPSRLKEFGYKDE